MATKRQGTPLWITIGCGCVLLLALVFGAVIAAGYFGVSAFKGYVEDMKDPSSRNARAGEILGASQLPEGYNTQLFFRVPWVIDMVMLSDGEPTVVENDDFELDEDSFGQHAFFFLILRRGEMDEEELEKMLRGEPVADGVRIDMGLEVDSEEELGRGVFEIPPQQLAYVAHRGELELDDRPVKGIFSQMFVTCPDDDLSRLAIWIERRGEDDEALEVEGSPADEEELRRFMGHFNLCAG